MRNIKMIARVGVGLLLSSASGAAAPALQSPPSPQKEWDYPELLVTPRASERVEREAKIESRSGFRAHWAIQASALGTLSAGLLQLGNTNLNSDPNRYGALTGIGVGGGWIAATFILSRYYRPYADGVSEMSALPKGTPREQLARERAAEEVIEDAARLGTRLRWLSVLSNAAASVYMLSNAKEGSIARTADVGALLLSFTPVIFPSRWMLVERDQQNYKKRIFAPIASTTLIRTSESSVSPALALTWDF